MSNLVQTISEEVTAAVARDQLILPTLPEVELRIRDTAENEYVTAGSLADVVAEDPGISARLIKVANSPIFRAVQAIDDLRTAIGRIGVRGKRLDRTRNAANVSGNVRVDRPQITLGLVTRLRSGGDQRGNGKEFYKIAS